MKQRVILVVPLIFMIVFSLIAVAQESGTASPKSNHIKGHGCVKAGKVPGCYVVNDYKAHRKYSVFFSKTTPDMDTGISFEGIALGHADPHCKQGQRVDVAEWKPLAGECPQTQKPAGQ